MTRWPLGSTQVWLALTVTVWQFLSDPGGAPAAGAEGPGPDGRPGGTRRRGRGGSLGRRRDVDRGRARRHGHRIGIRRHHVAAGEANRTETHQQHDGPDSPHRPSLRQPRCVHPHLPTRPQPGKAPGPIGRIAERVDAPTMDQHPADGPSLFEWRAAPGYSPFDHTWPLALEPRLNRQETCRGPDRRHGTPLRGGVVGRESSMAPAPPPPRPDLLPGARSRSRPGRPQLGGRPSTCGASPVRPSSKPSNDSTGPASSDSAPTPQHTVCHGERCLAYSGRAGRPLAPGRRLTAENPAAAAGPRLALEEAPHIWVSSDTSDLRPPPQASAPIGPGAERTDPLSKPSGHFTCQQQRGPSLRLSRSLMPCASSIGLGPLAPPGSPAVPRGPS